MTQPQQSEQQKAWAGAKSDQNLEGGAGLNMITDTGRQLWRDELTHTADTEGNHSMGQPYMSRMPVVIRTRHGIDAKLLP